MCISFNKVPGVVLINNLFDSSNFQWGWFWLQVWRNFPFIFIVKWMAKSRKQNRVMSGWWDWKEPNCSRPNFSHKSWFCFYWFDHVLRCCCLWNDVQSRRWWWIDVNRSENNHQSPHDSILIDLFSFTVWRFNIRQQAAIMRILMLCPNTRSSCEIEVYSGMNVCM